MVHVNLKELFILYIKTGKRLGTDLCGSVQAVRYSAYDVGFYRFRIGRETND